MPGSNVLLYTSVVIELFRGNAAIVSALETYPLVTIPFVVLGEFYLGAYRS